LLEDIINNIIGAGLATAKDTDIFKDYVPPIPDSCIIVSEYQGSPVADFTDVSVRSVQVMVRNLSKVSAKQLCWSIFQLFCYPTKIVNLRTRICIVANRNTPFKIGVDEKNRAQYVFNMGITTNFD
jgi:hypothetical protein